MQKRTDLLSFSRKVRKADNYGDRREREDLFPADLADARRDAEMNLVLECD